MPHLNWIDIVPENKNNLNILNSNRITQLDFLQDGLFLFIHIDNFYIYIL